MPYDETEDSRSPNIHLRYSPAKKEYVYGLGVWDNFHNNFTMPLTAEERRVHGKGATAWIDNNPHCYYDTLEEAEKSAKKIWGYAKLDE